MDFKFKKVRKKLDNLGYLEVLTPEALPLVEKLLSDLIQKTECCKNYKQTAKDVTEERDQLLLGVEPYKCDNAKLAKECNDLHSTFLQIREENLKLKQDLKRRLTIAERDKREAELECEKLKKRTRELQFESAKKTCKSAHSKSKCCNSNSTVTMSEHKIASLSKEIKKLKDEYMQLSQVNDTYKTQLTNREREIERLNQILQGGRPMQAVKKDFFHSDIEGQMCRLHGVITDMEKEKCNLELQLKEAVSKQHEAMRRALNLADRNKKLEKELRDIDHMALAVEADCNNTVKISSEKVNRMQMKIHDSLLQIQTLERDLSELKRDKQILLADVDSLKLEKRHLQSVLETALEDKKRLNDQINKFTIIEHDLNLEIDRLVQSSANQKRKVAELECRLLADKFESVTDRSNSPTRESSPASLQLSRNISKKAPKKVNKSSSPKRGRSKSAKGSKPKKSKSQIRKPEIDHLGRRSLSTTEDSLVVRKMPPKARKSAKSGKAGKKKGTPDSKRSKPEVYKASKSEQRVTVESKPPHNSPNVVFSSDTTKSLLIGYDNDEAVNRHDNRGNCPCCMCAQEHQFKSRFDKPRYEQFYTPPDKSLADEKKLTAMENQTELRQKLNEKEQLIACLQHENKVLAQEKHNLMTRLESAKTMPDYDYDSSSFKTALKRAERELDIVKGDLIRVEEEKNALRYQLKNLTENKTTEQEKIKKDLLEAEEQIRELERERRELMHGQGTRRATISVLEDRCQSTAKELVVYQTQLSQQKAMYGQLKTLHEQTDQALADSQAQLIQLEAELEKTKSRTHSLQKDKENFNKEVTTLRNNVLSMKDSLTKIDSEKDCLLISVDDKTEKVCSLEEQLKFQDDQLQQLRNSVTELKQQLSLTLDSTNSREQLLRNASKESASLRQEVETVSRKKESAIQENRRLQQELTSSTTDLRLTCEELNSCKNQIEDLKTQLQQYVAEVKRFEDLMSDKETERAEILDQFKSLSQEAVVLENNNHSLENQATQSKVQLSVTLDHVADLENKITSQYNLLSNYERKISELTSKVESLESQLAYTIKQLERAECDLASIRDLCMKLDKQKDNLMRELNEKNNQTSQVDREVHKMRLDNEALLASMTQDRAAMGNAEALLADSRRESVHLKLHNQELESEIHNLKQQIEEIQTRLVTTNQQLDLYQDRALDYSEQNKQLRRELADERFSLSKEGGGDSKKYPSL